MSSKVASAVAKKSSAPKDEAPSSRAQRERIKASVDAASSLTAPAVVNSLSALKLKLNESVDGILNTMVTEIGTLKEIREAIVAQKAELENLYQIRAEADTLQALIDAQSEEREKFARDHEEEISLKNKKIHEAEAAYSERQQQRKLEREREQDQFDYEQQRQRQRDKDEWDKLKEDKFAEIEEYATRTAASLDDRERLLTVRETELGDLKRMVDSFPARLEKEVKDAVATAEKNLQRDLEHAYAIRTTLADNEKNLLKEQIRALNFRIEELSFRCGDLEIKYKEATDKVQTIAEKAIEGASKQGVVVNTATEATRK